MDGVVSIKKGHVRETHCAVALNTPHPPPVTLINTGRKRVWPGPLNIGRKVGWDHWKKCFEGCQNTEKAAKKLLRAVIAFILRRKTHKKTVGIGYIILKALKTWSTTARALLQFTIFGMYASRSLGVCLSQSARRSDGSRHLSRIVGRSRLPRILGYHTGGLRIARTR